MLKKYIILVVLTLLGLKSLFSQNLVPNPSFEEGTDFCYPVEFSFNYGTYASHWSCPTLGTSDIFSSLVSDTSCYSLEPHNGIRNHIGTQPPRTGKRFAGIITYESSTISDSVYREYLQVPLTQPLIAGEYYCAEMYVSAADYTNLSSNNLGMLFTENGQLTKEELFFGILSYSPQIIEKNIITDTANWIRVSGTFRASAAFGFLTIGNFNNTYQTSTVIKANYPVHPYLLNRNQAYYFIDDISVEHLIPPTILSADKITLCQGESTTLEIKGFDDVTWTTVEDTVTVLHTGGKFQVSPETSTRYRVTVKNCNMIVKDTIAILINPSLKVNLGNDTTICKGSSVQLNAGALPGSLYHWQDNSSSQYLTVEKAGTYAVSVTNPFNNCVGYDEVNISMETVPEVDLGKDTIACNAFFPLKGGGNHAMYRWSTGSADSVLTPTEPGKYWVVVENQCGHASDTVNVYLSSKLFAPNVLTLDDNPANDDFRLVPLDQNQGFHLEMPVTGKLKVYNRWGTEIFSKNNYLNEWPSKNNIPDSGIYYFMFNYRGCSVYKGWIQLLK